jgi:pyrimidine operon attenuation protein/uracil phosphoribosyltransferase
MTPEDVRRAITSIAHEIVEAHKGLDHVALVGLQTGGVPLAGKLGEALHSVEGVEVPVGSLDVAFYRDDIGLRPVLPEAVTEIPFDLTGKTVVLVDDVLFTGRTIRAALNALNDYGRAKAVRQAVMVDRGHRCAAAGRDRGPRLARGRCYRAVLTVKGVREALTDRKDELG